MNHYLGTAFSPQQLSTHQLNLPKHQGSTLLSLLISTALSLLSLGSVIFLWQATHQRWQLQGASKELEQQANIAFKIIATSMQQNDPNTPLSVKLPPHFGHRFCCQHSSDSIAFSVKAFTQLHQLCQPADYPSNINIGFWLFIDDHSLKCKPYNPLNNQLLEKNSAPLVFGVQKMRINYGFLSANNTVIFHSAATLQDTPSLKKHTLLAITIELTMETAQIIPRKVRDSGNQTILSESNTLLSTYKRWLSIKQYH